jgi:hypothetical protein
MRSTKLLLPAAFGGGLVRGAERGFNERADIMGVAGDGTDLNEMYREVAETLDLHNQWRNRLMDRLTFRITKTVETVGVPSYSDFEPASEYGQPVGHRGIAKRHRGYPFRFYDLGERYTWMWLAEAERGDLENLHNQAMEADNRLIFNSVMKTLFNPVNGIGTADSNIPVNVYKLYNADGEVPPPWKTYTFDGTHSHYLINNNATVRSIDLDNLAEQLIHHGHDPLEGATLVLMMNKQEANIAKTFKVATGAAYDFIPSANYGGGVFLPANGGIIGAPSGNVPDEFGTYGPWHLVREDNIPAGYVVGLASGGPNNVGNPVGIREHTNEAYRGLKVIPGQRSQYPLVDAFYRRGFGTGIRQRGGAVIMQIAVGASYVTPAAYV